MLVINIPHASIKIDDYSDFCLNKEEVDTEAKKLADLYTDEMIDDLPFVKKVCAATSRIVVDTERFTDDAQEIAAAYGMGVIYTKTHDAKTLREAPSPKKREELLNKYYYPHHQKLNQYVNDNLSKYGKCFILDLHSYSKISVRSDEENPFMPDICIGYSDYHFNQSILDIFISFCKEHGYSYALNTPFAGSIVPLEHYLKTPNVVSFMLEINKSVYMNNKTFSKKDTFTEFKKHLESLTKQLYSDFYG